MVPWHPSMASARVMMTRATPASKAAKAFSIFGIMPPEITPSATYLLYITRVRRGMTLLSSLGSVSTPGFSKAKMRVTS